MKKTYKLRQYRRGESNVLDEARTVEEWTQYFGYTLEVGQSWQHEKGNRKINRKPTTIKSLITNVNNALNNAARNGYSGTYYELEETE